MLIYKYSFEKEAIGNKNSFGFKYNFDCQLIIFETLANVNEFLKGGRGFVFV